MSYSSPDRGDIALVRLLPAGALDGEGAGFNATLQAWVSVDLSGVGDMLEANYDPNTVRRPFFHMAHHYGVVDAGTFI